MQSAKKLPHIIVLGGGFGGLEFCQKMKGQPARITLIDRQNHHLFQPLLYQVATAGLSAPDVAQPIRSILSGQENLQVLMDEAVGIDLNNKKVSLCKTGNLSYDYLIIAIGAKTHYYGKDEWEPFAPGLKTLDDARNIRHKVLLAFEEAERTSDPAERERLMRIIIVGGGPTGVELAGSFAELAKRVLARDFQSARPQRAQVLLLEVAPRILGPFSEKLSKSAVEQLTELGVEVRTGQKLKEIREGEVELENETIQAANILWGAGVRAHPLCETLPVKKDKSFRLLTEPDLSLSGYPEVFAVGDIVNLKDVKGKQVPGVSPAAMQMGRHAAQVIIDEIGQSREQTHSPRKPFSYWDKGSMATIGRSRAVAQVGKLEFTGFLAWLAWLFVHLIFLVGFRNKLSVLMQWFYSYINFRRGARLITGQDDAYSHCKTNRQSPQAPGSMVEPK